MKTLRHFLAFFLIIMLLLPIFSIVHAAPITSLTSEENQKVSQQVLLLQNQILDASSSFLSNIAPKFENLSSFIVTGSGSLKYQDETEYGNKTISEYSFTDYLLKKSNNDFQVTGKLHGNSSVQGSYPSQISIDTLLDLISKNGNMFIQLKDLKQTSTDASISEELKKFKDNSYVKIPSDIDFQAMLHVLNELDMNQKIIKNNQPLLKGIGKKDNKIILAPTQYACDTYLSAQNKINVFGEHSSENTCDTKMYQMMVDTFLQLGDLYMVFNNDGSSTLGFTGASKDPAIQGNIVFDSASIQKVSLSIIPDQKILKGESYSFQYEKNKSIILKLLADSGDTSANINATLNEKNQITVMTAKFLSENYSSRIQGNLDLKDKKIIGTFDSFQYNTQNGKKKVSEVFGIRISGNLDGNNGISMLKGNIFGIDYVKKTKYLNGNLSYNLGVFTFDGKNTNYYDTYTIKGNGKISDDYFQIGGTLETLTQGTSKYSFILNQKDQHFDLDVGFNAIKNGKIITQFTLKNTSIKQEKTTSIQAPTKYKEWNDAYEMGKANDVKRISDLNALQAGIEQVYQDTSEYPSKEDFNKRVAMYITKIPSDQLSGQTINGCTFGYSYGVGSDMNGIKNGAYTLSTCLESELNIQKYAINDGGFDNKKYELGNGITDKKIKTDFISKFKK